MEVRTAITLRTAAAWVQMATHVWCAWQHVRQHLFKAFPLGQAQWPAEGFQSTPRGLYKHVQHTRKHTHTHIHIHGGAQTQIPYRALEEERFFNLPPPPSPLSLSLCVPLSLSLSLCVPLSLSLSLSLSSGPFIRSWCRQVLQALMFLSLTKGLAD